jgi:hypothetical protein
VTPAVMPIETIAIIVMLSMGFVLMRLTPRPAGGVGLGRGLRARTVRCRPPPGGCEDIGLHHAGEQAEQRSR